jgi:TolB-like protein/DNA-binding SARP family transcriptional activator/Flp pilus assembly protein TadD
MLRLQTLGGLALLDESGAAVATQRRRLALLALLAAAGERGLTRDKVVAYFWPESSAENARHALEQLLYELRRQVSDKLFLGTDPIALDPKTIETDLGEFRGALSRGAAADAVGYYRGAFLDGLYLRGADAFERWSESERARLAAECRGALEKLARAEAERGDYAREVEWRRKLVALDPLGTQGALDLIRALVAAGDRSGALQYARVYDALVRKELSSAPDAELTELVQQLRDSGDTPSLDARTPTPTPRRDQPASGPLRLDSSHPIASSRIARLAVGLLLGAAVVGFVAITLRGARRRDDPSSSAAAPSSRYSLAVLPLKNHSDNAAQDYFADGMTEELTTTLSKIQALRVIAHQSVRQFRNSDRPIREIAQRLDVRYIVDASLTVDSDRVRIIATLIDAERDAPLWTERFERERREVMALQHDVALAIANGIEIALTPEDQTRLQGVRVVNPDAYDEYLLATVSRYRASTTNDFREAIRHFVNAIRLDSTYGPAYSGLAFSLVRSGDRGGARTAVGRALALDPSSAEAHLAAGMLRELADWDWSGAEAAFRESIRLNPGYAEAHYELGLLLMRQRHLEQAMTSIRRAVFLAPTSGKFASGITYALGLSGDYRAARQALARELTLDSDTLGFLFDRFQLEIAEKNYAGAVQAMDLLARKSFEFRGGSAYPYFLGERAYAYAKAGRRAEALGILGALKSELRFATSTSPHVQELSIAAAYMGLDDPLHALDWLEKAFVLGGPVMYIGDDHVFDPLHNERRFQEILKRVGLPVD